MQRTLLFLAPALLTLAACGGGDNSSPTGGTSSPTTIASATPTPTTSADETKYANHDLGYSLELPIGWRVATQFMDSFGALHAVPQGTGDSSVWAVLTDIPAEDESRFVAQAVPTPGLTGLEPWLGFFLLGTVEVFPTTYDLEQQLVSVKDGNVWHLVSDVRDFPLGSQSPGTRYTVEILNDYWHYLFDTVFIPAMVIGCQDCTGFILETVIAGRSPLQSPGPIELPPAAYPRGSFESIVSSFVPTTAAAASPTPPPSSTPTSAASPIGWKSYTDPRFGFSLSYPPDLIMSDLTGPSPADGINERAVQFRSASDQSRSFAVSISSNGNGRTLQDWVLEFTACLPETKEQGTVDRMPAIFCTALSEQIPEAAVAFQLTDSASLT